MLEFALHFQCAAAMSTGPVTQLVTVKRDGVSAGHITLAETVDSARSVGCQSFDFLCVGDSAAA